MIKRILGLILLFPFMVNTAAFGFDPYQKDLDINHITCKDFLESLWPLNAQGINGGAAWEGNAIFTWLAAIKSPDLYSPSLLLQTESQLARSCSQDKTALIATLYPMSYDQAVKDSKVHDDGRAVSFRDIRCDSVLEFISENAITAYYRSTTLSLAAIWYFAHNNPTKKFNLGPLKALADTVLPACKAKPSLYLFPLIQVKMQKYDQP